MKKIFTKTYNTSSQELAIRVFGILLTVISAAYLVTYVVEVG